MSTGLKALCVLLVFGASGAALWGWRSSAAPERGAAAPRSTVPQRAPRSLEPAAEDDFNAAEPSAPAAPRQRVVEPPEPAAAEASLMVELRQLGDLDPERALELARTGNARFPASPDAPERAWFVVRSLVNLERFDEAVSEARGMVRAYPDTPFALDVERHLLVHPIDYPSREEQQERAAQEHEPPG